jgi:2-methylcitrate dehydratase PrpD
VTHPAIDAVRRLARLTGASSEEVKRIDLGVHPLVMELTNKRNPRTGLEGKFSIAFVAAITWIEGTARHRQFTNEKVNRPDVQALMGRVCIAEDNSLSQIEARATVCLRGGKTSSEHIYHATGTPENPISDEELREKFTELVEPELGARAVRRIVACVEKLREDEPLEPLLGALAPAAAVPE